MPDARWDRAGVSSDTLNVWGPAKKHHMPQCEGGWVPLRAEGPALTPMGDPELGPFPETILALVQGSGDEPGLVYLRGM